MRERKEENNRSSKPKRGRWSQAEIARLKELYGLREDAAIARELNRPMASVRKMAEKIFPLVERTGPWSEREVLRLKEYLGASKPKVIARILGRPVPEVEEHIQQLAQVQSDQPWSRDELVRFKRIYGTRTDEDLVAIFGRSLASIQALAAKHALAKDKAFKRRREGEASTRMPRWSAEEVDLLRRLYPSVANLKIALELDRTVKSVVSKAHNLELKKSNERLKEMGRQNVSLRYQEEAPTEPVVELQVTPPRKVEQASPTKARPIQPLSPGSDVIDSDAPGPNVAKSGVPEARIPEARIPELGAAKPGPASPGANSTEATEPNVEIPRGVPKAGDPKDDRVMRREDQLDGNGRS